MITVKGNLTGINNTEMKDEIYNLIRNNPQLRELIGKEMNVLESTVYTHAVRKAPCLEKKGVLRILTKATGLKEHELFEKESAA